MKKLILALVVFGLMTGSAMAWTDNAGVTLDILPYASVNFDADSYTMTIQDGADNGSVAFGFNGEANFAGTYTVEFTPGAGFASDWSASLTNGTGSFGPGSPLAGSGSLELSGLDMNDTAAAGIALGELTVTISQ